MHNRNWSSETSRLRWLCQRCANALKDCTKDREDHIANRLIKLRNKLIELEDLYGIGHSKSNQVKG